MDTYLIPRTDLEVSRIAYGCMNLGGRWDHTPLTEVERTAAAKVVHTTLQEGINIFDHADIYTYGKSEEVFGDVLRRHPDLRAQIVLQSKCGIRFEGDSHPDDPSRYDFSYKHIITSVEGSLRRLGTDYLDILLLHRPDPLIEPEEVARAFSDLKRGGKVRYFGVSNHTIAQIELLRAYLDQPLVINQLELNPLHAHLINDGVVANVTKIEYSAAAGILDYCRLNSILVQAWAPVAGGILFDTPEDAPAHVQETARLVAKLADAKGTTREAILLAWLLRHPAGIQPVIGTTKPDRVVASCRADSVELTREEWYAIFISGRGSPLP